jgi:dihydrofolate reductase/thymidylate synthase
MFDIIIACQKNGGIGYLLQLPWSGNKDELSLFKNKTLNSILIMGRKTVETLPYLKNRIIYCLSKQHPLVPNKPYNVQKYTELTINKLGKNNIIFSSNLNNILTNCQIKYPNKSIYIAGGSQIYNYIFTNYLYLINKIHISIMNSSNICDSFFDLNLISDWKNEIVYHYDSFTHYVKIKSNTDEIQYLNLLKIILNSNNRIGRNGNVLSSFNHNLKFDLRNGFPLLTTKKMFFRGIFEELLFFIKGQTNSKILEEKKINIWKPNTSRQFLDNLNMTHRPDGIMGPLYGAQWRHFNGNYNEISGESTNGIDQLQNVINLIQNDPTSRRILLTDYNPSQAHLGVLYPCHSLILQFYVDNNFLDVFCYNRSSDIFLGLPFNIASSSLLLIFIAKITKLIPRYLYLTLGDTHIYYDHINAVKTQLERKPYNFPILNITKNINNLSDIENLLYSDILLSNYNFHPSIIANMIA